MIYHNCFLRNKCYVEFICFIFVTAADVGTNLKSRYAFHPIGILSLKRGFFFLMLKNFQLTVVFLEALGLRNVLLTCIFGALGVIFLCGVIYIARRYLLQVLQNFYFTKSNVFDMFSRVFNFSTHFSSLWLII